MMMVTVRIRPLALAGLMISMALVAVEATVVATAVPTIIGDLGGESWIGAVFAAYLLAQAAVMPIAAKIADARGRVLVLLVALGIFAIGSAIAGGAPHLLIVVVGRAIQGIGAGAVQPLVMTLASDISTEEQRARTQGALAAVWGLASVAGPLVGGLLVQLDLWRWVFLGNIPLTAVGCGLVWFSIRDVQRRSATRIDGRGALFLCCGISGLLFALLQGGEGSSLLAVAAGAVGVLMVGLYGLHQRTVPDPILPLSILSDRTIALTMMMTGLLGAGLTGISTIVPTTLQTAGGVLPLTAGFAVASVTMGWPVAAAFSGWVIQRWGYRRCILMGVGVFALGMGGLAASAPLASPGWTAIAGAVIGIGCGLSFSPALLLTQATQPAEDRAVVTSVNSLARAIGGAFGATVFGRVLSAGLSVDSGVGLHLTTTVGWAFVVVAVVAVLVFALLLLLPRTPVPAAEDQRPDNTVPDYSGTESRPSHVATDAP